jgi:DNA-binding response OmpR family regulator
MHKILVIDDDPDFQVATQMVLEKNEFQVVTAYNADEGIQKVQSEKPDLIILDVVMPQDYEGFDVARKVREDLKMRELPIILLSAVHTIKKVPYRFAPHEQWLPVDYFFDKPVESQVLVGKIKELLNIES